MLHLRMRGIIPVCPKAIVVRPILLLFATLSRQMADLVATKPCQKAILCLAARLKNIQLPACSMFQGSLRSIIFPADDVQAAHIRPKREKLGRTTD